MKELAELAEINESVRKTYYKGNQRIDETTPSDYKAMKPYIDIADDIRANAMDKFNQL